MNYQHCPVVTTCVHAGDEIGANARELIAGLTMEPLGRSSPSTYETGRLVALAPWLVGHTERITYLLTQQSPGGGWGAPDGYALVPTLSATEALLGVLLDHAGAQSPPVPRGRLVQAVRRGLEVLHDWLRPPGRLAVPDLPAVDLTVPALIGEINAKLDRLRDSPVDGLPERPDRLGLPAGMSAGRLVQVRAALAAGVPVPEKLLHALEVVPDLAPGATGVAPEPPGIVGASPAATAAWLGAPSATARDEGARTFLEEVVRRYDGPVPCALPITVFERSWVLSGLARAQITVTVPPHLLVSLSRSLGPDGTPAGPGLPADADTTSVTLYALAMFGSPSSPDCLDRYELDTHFCTWLGEDGSSVTTNAHVLDALGQRLLTHPQPRTAAAARKVSHWLCAQQRADGSWQDRWHASPYYATASCVLALDAHGLGPDVPEAVARAMDWVIATQRPDGSWGRWTGTVEETAYALQVLLAPGRPPRPGAGTAAGRGHAYLLAAAGHEPDPPLWHDKDLYLPPTIVRAATLSALQLARHRPELVTPGNSSGHC